MNAILVVVTELVNVRKNANAQDSSQGMGVHMVEHDHVHWYLGPSSVSVVNGRQVCGVGCVHRADVGNDSGTVAGGEVVHDYDTSCSNHGHSSTGTHHETVY